MNKRIMALGAILAAGLALTSAGCTVVVNSENVNIKQESQIAGSEFFETAGKLGEAVLTEQPTE